MYLYLIFGLLAIVAFLFDIVSGKKNNLEYKIVFLGIIMLFFCISVFRWEVGPDWGPYWEHFELMNGTQSGLQFNFEPGYNLLVALNKWITPNYNFHLGIEVLIIYALVPMIIYKYSPYPFLSVLIWLSIGLGYMFPTRQTIATAILIYSMKYVIRRNFVKYILTLVISMFFHYSAIIFLPVYFLFYKKVSLVWIIPVILGLFVLVFISSDIVSNALLLVGGDFFQEKLKIYMEVADENFGSAYSVREILFRGLLNRSFILIIVILFLNKLRSENVLFNGWFNMYLMSLFLFICITPLSVALNRVCMYYDISQIFFIPYLLQMKMTKYSQYIVFFLLAGYLFIRFRGVIINYQDLYIPYKTIFDS